MTRRFRNFMTIIRYDPRFHPCGSARGKDFLLGEMVACISDETTGRRMQAGQNPVSGNSMCLSEMYAKRCGVLTVKFARVCAM